MLLNNINVAFVTDIYYADFMSLDLRLIKFSPLEVDSGDVEDHTFEPEDHEEALGERTVSDALAITTSLQTQRYIFTYISPPAISKSSFILMSVTCLRPVLMF